MNERDTLEKLQSMAESVCDCYCIHPKTMLTESEMEEICDECPLNDYVRCFAEHKDIRDIQKQTGWKENFMQRFCKVN